MVIKKKMKRIIKKEKIKYICDNCKKEMEFVSVELSFGYGSRLDGKEYEFCSDKCLKEFINKK